MDTKGTSVQTKISKVAVSNNLHSQLHFLHSICLDEDVVVVDTNLIDLWYEIYNTALASQLPKLHQL